MSRVEVWKDGRTKGFAFSGILTERDLILEPGEIIARVKNEIVGRVVDILMRDLGPKIEKVINEALCDAK